MLCNSSTTHHWRWWFDTQMSLTWLSPARLPRLCYRNGMSFHVQLPHFASAELVFETMDKDDRKQCLPDYFALNHLQADRDALFSEAGTIEEGALDNGTNETTHKNQYARRQRQS